MDKIFLKLFILSFFGIAFVQCSSLSVQRRARRVESVANLENQLFKDHDIQAFNALVIKNCRGENLDIKRYAHFVVDSLRQVRVNTYLGENSEEQLYYRALASAYYPDQFCVYVRGKDCTEVRRDILRYHSSLLRYRPVSSEDTQIQVDSLRSAILNERDTSAYLSIRQIISIVELLPLAKWVADSLSFDIACHDTYRLMCEIQGRGLPLSSSEFTEAYPYLDKAAQNGYLPSVFQKSLLLLMGVYLPQDTIKGKELLDKCLITPPCTTPFWRYVPKEK